MLTVRTLPGLVNLEVNRHVNRRLLVITTASEEKGSSVRQSVILTLADIQMSKFRPAPMKKTSATADTADVPRLTRAIENETVIISPTLTTEKLYIRHQWD